MTFVKCSAGIVLTLLAFACPACVGRSAPSQAHRDPPPPHPMMAVAVREERAPSLAPLPSPGARSIGHCDAAMRARDPMRLTLAHLNDMQARYSELLAGRSRYAYVAGYLRRLKEEVPETLVLDAGDDYEKGSIAELSSMGESTRQMIQALPIDVRTVGNHDFAYGEAAVLRDVSLSQHPVLAANIARKGGEKGPFLPFARFDVGCVKVGVVGLVTGNYGADDQPTREPFDGVFVQDDHVVDVLTREVREHRAEVDVMIALDHLGYWQDVELAMKVPGVDLVIGGHSEDLVKEPRAVTRADGSRAWILQAGHYARNVGRADITVSRKDKGVVLERYKMITIDEAVPYAVDVALLARSIEREHAPDSQTPIALTHREIKAGKPMADLTWRAVSESWGADGLLIGKDLFWDGLPAGPVTLQRLFDTVLVQRQPAGTSGFSSLYLVSLTGQDLLTLRGRTNQGLFVFYAPEVIVPSRSYRIAIEKRALRYPAYAFGGWATLPEGRFGGELIDVLDVYARARTRRGLALD